MPRAIIFDLDGTLVDSLPGIANALNRALSSLDFPTHDETTVRTFIGNGSWMLCRRGAPHADEATIDKLNARFFRDYANTWQPGTIPYPGINELLQQLTTDNTPLAVFSNKPHDFTADIVAHIFPHTPFITVLGHKNDAPRKPDPNGALEIARNLNLPTQNITFIGDSTVDHETAVNAGMHPLLVDWGYHDRPSLEQTGATIVSSPGQILPALHPAS